MDLRHRNRIDYSILSGGKAVPVETMSTPNQEFGSGVKQDSASHGGSLFMKRMSGKAHGAMDRSTPSSDPEMLHLQQELEDLNIQERKVEIQLAVAEKRAALQEKQLKLQALNSGAVPYQGQVSSAPSVAQNSVYSRGPLARLDLDPKVYLQTSASGMKFKYRAIPEFVPRHSNRHDSSHDEDVELGGGYSLTCKGKLKPDQVSPSQWIAANANILGEMLEHDDIPPTELKNVVQEYTAYTVKVGELAVGHTWASVMLYDDEYRYQQARHKFPWGADSQHISNTLLVKRERKDNKSAKVQKSSTGRRETSTSSSTGTCDYYNEGKMCPHKECRFRHVCSTCGQRHRQADHVTAVKSGGAEPLAQQPRRVDRNE